MSRTGTQLIDGFSRFLNDYWHSTTTSASSDGSTLIDTALKRFGEDRLVGQFIRITQSGTNQYAVRRISSFSNSSGTVTVSPAFAATPGSGDTYELHRFDPVLKFKALDDARLPVFNDVFRIVQDETMTADGMAVDYPLPTACANNAPVEVYLEKPKNVGYSWNLLLSPFMDSLTGWTASAGSAEIVNRGTTDQLIPKYDQACTRLTVPSSTGVTYSQTVSSMKLTDASEYAGRRVTFEAWVYCRSASRVTLTVVDDSGVLATSNTHQGLGWERLIVTTNVSGGNLTTMTVRYNVSSGVATQVWMNRAWYFFGDQSPIDWIDEPLEDMYIDAVAQRIVFPEPPRRGRQILIVGKGILTALGDTASSQATNSMECDAQTEQLVFCEAAHILFLSQGLKVSDVKEVSQNIQMVNERRQQLRMNWSQPDVPWRITGPWE